MTKYLFIDRDGTLIVEPADFQIDSLEKFMLVKNMIPALIELSQAGYKMVMVTNQDALGTDKNPQDKFDMIQTLLMNILTSQGIHFEEVLICPHAPKDQCKCRKPATQLVHKYLASNEMDRENSYVIGDRHTDIGLAENMGIKGYLLSQEMSWSQIVRDILDKSRKAHVHRKTNETDIDIHVNLDDASEIQIATGLGFFDHMLEQIARHGQFGLRLKASGDLHIDEHHLVEDVAIALGAALKKALGDKRGIERYGFVLPMDEAQTQVAIDLSGRAAFSFKAVIPAAQVGGLSSEMVPHFFNSLSQAMMMSLQIRSQGENSHHIVESMFKGVGRSLAQAFSKKSKTKEVPSTKGML